MNIPKGQLIRLRRNCTTKTDYEQQADFIGERFIDKGYQRSFLQQKIEEVGNIERENLLKNKEKEEFYYEKIPLIFDYNIQVKNQSFGNIGKSC